MADHVSDFLVRYWVSKGELIVFSLKLSLAGLTPSQCLRSLVVIVLAGTEISGGGAEKKETDDTDWP